METVVDGGLHRRCLDMYICMRDYNTTLAHVMYCMYDMCIYVTLA